MYYAPNQDYPLDPQEEIQKEYHDYTPRNANGQTLLNGFVYASAAAEVNHRLFKALVPFYTTVKTQEDPKTREFDCYLMGMKVHHKYTQEIPVPTTFYTPVSDNQKIQTKITLARAIELCHQGENFIILDDVEVIQMFMLLDAYLNEIKSDVDNKDEVYLHYAVKCLKLREQLYRLFRRACWAFEPRGKAWNNYKKSVDTSLLRTLLGLEKKEHRDDGIDRLAEPPYSLTYVETLIKKIDDSKRIGPKEAKPLNIVEEYLKQADGAIPNRDPFALNPNDDPSHHVPELGSLMDFKY